MNDSNVYDQQARNLRRQLSKIESPGAIDRLLSDALRSAHIAGAYLVLLTPDSTPKDLAWGVARDAITWVLRHSRTMGSALSRVIADTTNDVVVEQSYKTAATELEALCDEALSEVLPTPTCSTCGQRQPDAHPHRVMPDLDFVCWLNERIEKSAEAARQTDGENRVTWSTRVHEATAILSEFVYRYPDRSGPES